MFLWKVVAWIPYSIVILNTLNRRSRSFVFPWVYFQSQVFIVIVRIIINTIAIVALYVFITVVSDFTESSSTDHVLSIMLGPEFLHDYCKQPNIIAAPFFRWCFILLMIFLPYSSKQCNRDQSYVTT